MITKEQYYDDKTHISNSMLSDFIYYEKGSQILTPETYHAKHITKQIVFEPTDDMLCGTIVDRYFSEGPQILDEYPIKSKRSGENPNEITNSMNDKVQGLIQTFKAFKSFQDFIKLPDTIIGNYQSAIRTMELELPSGRKIKLKGKFDFINDNRKIIVDQKTTGNVNTLYTELQYKGVPNIYHRYIRQMSLYSKLAGGYNTALAIGDEAGRMLFIPIRQDIIDRAWNVYVNDLERLMDYYDNNFTNLIQDPFADFPEDTQEVF